MKNFDAKTIIVSVIIAIVLFLGGATAGYFYNSGQFSDQLEDARGKISELEKSNARIKERNSELRRINGELEAGIEQLEDILGDITDTNRELRESLERAQESFEQAEGTLRRIDAGISNSVGDIDELIEFVRRLRDELRSYFETT